MLQVMSKSSHAKGWYAFDSDAVGARSAAALAFKWVMRWRRKGAGGQPPTLNDVSHSTSHHPTPPLSMLRGNLGKATCYTLLARRGRGCKVHRDAVTNLAPQRRPRLAGKQPAQVSEP